MENQELPKHWNSVKELFGAALEVEREQRDAFLRDACGANESLRVEIESLLSAYENSSELSRSPWLVEAAEAAAPQFVGPYHLLEKLGEGGMGQVWLAEQSAPVCRRVALKLIRTGIYDSGLLQRFQAERQSLALMDHPAIAKVFDAGTTEAGQPYFVMEYVHGLPITEYCDQKQLGIRERIELFIQVSEGVQHAHRKAIIHRDIKPANILVVEEDGEPTPRIIDFGLAKAVASQPGETLFTQAGAFLGTPGYVSPEQADPGVQDIDTRTDVYSLGVVLYVLLSGFEPLNSEEWRKLPLHEGLRRLREKDPPQPSTKVGASGGDAITAAAARGLEAKQLESTLQGDLDWIIMKAIERDRDRRYGTPSDLALDLQRYLNHEPVLARPASMGYRLQKYIRRHRFGVTAAGAAAVLLIAFGVLQALQLRRITRERDRASRVTEYMTNMFKLADPSEARGKTVTAREILDKASKDIGTGLAKDSELQAQMSDLMGVVYMNIGSYSSAEPLLEQAMNLWSQIKGPNAPETLVSRHNLAMVLGSKGRYADAEKLERQNLDVYRRVLGVKRADAIRSMSALGITIENEGHYQEAEALDRETLGNAREVLGDKNPDTLTVLNSVGSVLQRQGRYVEAEKLHLEALNLRKTVLGSDHPRTTITMQALASDYRAEGKFAEAEQLDRQVLEIRTRILGPEHPYTLSVRRDVARDLQHDGKYAEAAQMNRETIEMVKRVLGPEHSEVGSLLINLSQNLSDMGRFVESEHAAREAIEVETKALRADHPFTFAARVNLATALEGEGKFNEAEQEARKGMDGMRRILPADDPRVASATTTLVSCLIKEKKYQEAEPLAREVLEINRRTQGPDNEETAASAYNLACIRARQGRSEEAMALLRDAIGHGLPESAELKVEQDSDFASLHSDPRFAAIVATARTDAEKAPGTQ